MTLDMSPAALFPHYDHDTKSHRPSIRLTYSILFLWSKGSRQIHTYYIDSLPPSITVLPCFDAGDLQNAVTFLPKKIVDVKKVEVLQGLRLAAGNKIERFGFLIPRNRVHLLRNKLIVDGLLSGRHFCADRQY